MDLRQISMVVRQNATDNPNKTTYDKNELITAATWLLTPDLATSAMPEVIEQVLLYNAISASSEEFIFYPIGEIEKTTIRGFIPLSSLQSLGSLQQHPATLEQEQHRQVDE